MMAFKNLLLIGTSHIASESAKTVRKAIEEKKPAIIALELDIRRAQALLSHHRKRASNWYLLRRIGLKGLLFAMLGEFVQQKLGRIVKMEPGAEMKEALEIARKQKIKVAFIDQDIELTLRKLSGSISWRERWNFMADLVKGFLLKKPDIDFDLSKVPSEEIVELMIHKVKDRYPNIYCVLIQERNQIMAHRLIQIMQNQPEKLILAVVGAGHKKEMIRLIRTHFTSTVK